MSADVLPAGRRAAVRVPATSANLGPGFDAAGLALDLWDELRVETCARGLDIEIAGEGANDLTRDRDHLVVKAMQATFDHLGVRVAGLVLRCHNRIPQARGLGSSAAAIIGGILAARKLTPAGTDRLSSADVLALATDLEGHADNVAAALLGGFTLAWARRPDEPPERPLTDGSQARTSQRISTGSVGVLRLTPAAEIVPVLLVAPTRSVTAQARAVLPEAISHSDAAAAAGRAALLVAALTVAPDALLPGTHDLLHQPHRAALMPESSALVRRLRSQGLAAVVSGAGPTVLVLAAGPQQVAAATTSCPSGWKSLALAIADGAQTTS